MSAAAKHTPGPWMVREEGVIDSDHVTIAHCTFDALLMDDAAEERDANARLIAAAPDLLGALVRAEEWIRPLRTPGRGPLMDTIRAAIARATGGTP